MNISKIKDLAQGLGMDGTKINQVISKAEKYGIISDGTIRADANVAKRIINENGGDGVLEKAIRFSKKPLVKIGLNKIGITTDVINDAVEEIRGIAGNEKTSSAPAETKQTTRSGIRSRLDKLV